MDQVTLNIELILDSLYLYEIKQMSFLYVYMYVINI